MDRDITSTANGVPGRDSSLGVRMHSEAVEWQPGPRRIVSENPWDRVAYAGFRPLSGGVGYIGPSQNAQRLRCLV